MVRFLFKLLLTLIAASLLAFAVGWWGIRKGQLGNIEIGPWSTNLNTGGAGAGLYQRARVALYGLWAMNSSESIYFVATADDGGAPLSCDCDYRITGRDPEARWWSLAIYEDFHFIDNPIDRYAVNAHTVERDADGSWTILLSAEPQDRNWLPGCSKGGEMILNLRFYNPSEAFRHHLEQQPLPSISKINCR